MSENGTKYETQVNRIQRKNPLTSILSDVGKLQPQAVDVEEAVLGALILDREAVISIMDFLEPDSFYKDEHKTIFESIITIFKLNKPIDLITVTNELRSTGKLEFAGGAFYISELTNRVSSSANIEFHAMIVAQKYLAREVIRISTEAQRDAYDDATEIFDLLDRFQNSSLAITQKFISSATKSIGQVAQNVFKTIDDLSKSDHKILGIPSGIKALDNITQGFQKKKLYIIAGRPGMGKSTLARCIAKNAAIDLKIPVGVLSLEEGEDEYATGLYAIITQIDSTKIKKANQLTQGDFEQLHYAAKAMDNTPLYIDDSASVTSVQLRAKAKQLVMKYHIEMLIVDYLQLAHGSDKKQNREQEIADISRTLKLISKELNIPVIAISQLSRAVESRGGSKRPQLSDLRESGAIEQDADCVIFCFRPEYYGIAEDDDGSPTAGIAELLVEKNRGGAKGTAVCHFNAPTNTFEDIEKKAAYKNYYEPETQATYRSILNKANETNDEPPY